MSKKEKDDYDDDDHKYCLNRRSEFLEVRVYSVTTADRISLLSIPFLAALFFVGPINDLTPFLDHAVRVAFLVSALSGMASHYFAEKSADFKIDDLHDRWDENKLYEEEAESIYKPLVYLANRIAFIAFGVGLALLAFPSGLIQ